MAVLKLETLELRRLRSDLVLRKFYSITAMLTNVSFLFSKLTVQSVE